MMGGLFWMIGGWFWIIVGWTFEAGIVDPIFCAGLGWTFLSGKVVYLSGRLFEEL